MTKHECGEDETTLCFSQFELLHCLTWVRRTGLFSINVYNIHINFQSRNTLTSITDN